MAILLLTLSQGIYSQNILENGSFEIGYTSSWGVIKSVDGYHNNISSWLGTMYPQDGSYYAGLRFHSVDTVTSPNWQEYIYQSVTGKMQEFQIYKVSIYYCIADMCTLTTDDFGIAFIDNPYILSQWNAGDLIGTYVTPDIKLPDGYFPINDETWQNLTSYYTANGHERSIIVGSFKLDSNIDRLSIPSDYTHVQADIYFFIDNIEVIPCIDYPEIELEDRIITCEEGNVQIDATSFPSSSYQWSTGDTTAVITPMITSSQYISVAITNNGCTYKDSVFVRLFKQSNQLKDVISCDDSVFPLTLDVEHEIGESILWENGFSNMSREITKSGTYSYVKKLEECEQHDTVTIYVWQDDVYLYPNPGVDHLNISNEENVRVVSISTAEGKLVRKGPIASSELDFLISQLSSGVYFFELDKEGCYSTIKYEKINLH